jgi:hypothetical protein
LPPAKVVKLDKLQTIAFNDYVKQGQVSKSPNSYTITERKEDGKDVVEISPNGGWQQNETGGCGTQGCDVTFFIDPKTLKILLRTIGT